MARYSYKGLDATGKKVAGQVEADTEKEAVRLLRDESIFATQVKVGGSGDGGRKSVAHILTLLNPVRLFPVLKGDLIILFNQIALMLRSGYTLVPALQAAREMQVKWALVRTIDEMVDAIRAGASLSQSMKVNAKLFPPMVVNLVAIGERSGNLDYILERVGENLERMKDLKRQLVSAMIYPTIVILSSVGLIVYLVTTVIPQFAVFLTARGSALPGSTQMMLDVSGWMVDYGMALGIGVGVGVFAILVAYTFEPGKRVMDRVLLYVPLIGKAIQFGGMAQTGWSLALCLRSGIPALDALRINAQAMNNFALRDSFECAGADLLVGRSISKAIEQPFIPLMVRHMTAVGEKSGELDSVMFEVGIYYQKELAAKVKFMSAIIEPIMILLVGGLVGFVYFSIFQAVMSVSKGGM